MAGAGATNAHEAEMLDTDLDRTGWSIALFTTMPTDDAGAGLVEVSSAGGTNYSRYSIATATDWAAAVGGAPTTKAGPKTGVTWTFPEPGTADWGNVKGFGLYFGGALKWIGYLPAPKDILATDPAPVFNETHQIIAELGDQSDTF